MAFSRKHKNHDCNWSITIWKVLKWWTFECSAFSFSYRNCAFHWVPQRDSSLQHLWLFSQELSSRFRCLSYKPCKNAWPWPQPPIEQALKCPRGWPSKWRDFVLRVHLWWTNLPVPKSNLLESPFFKKIVLPPCCSSLRPFLGKQR